MMMLNVPHFHVQTLFKTTLRKNNDKKPVEKNYNSELYNLDNAF